MEDPTPSACIWPTCMVIGCSDLCPDRPGGEPEPEPERALPESLLLSDLHETSLLVQGGVQSPEQFDVLVRTARGLVAEVQRLAVELNIPRPSSTKG